MSIEIITKEDLHQFRLLLLQDIQQLIVPSKPQQFKPWLKNAEVKELLKISSNTIQRLRIAGNLPSTKIGGIHYYRYDDIERLMQTK